MLFLSYARKRSQGLARELKGLIRAAFPHVKIHFLPQPQSGNSWRKTLFEKLNDTRLAIICLTQDNYRSRWIHYEAGALLHAIGDARRVVVLKFPNDRLEGDFSVEAPLDDLELFDASRGEQVELLLELVADVLQQGPLDHAGVAGAVSDFVRAAHQLFDANVLESSAYLNRIHAESKKVSSSSGTIFRQNLAHQVLKGVSETLEELSKAPKRGAFEQYISRVSAAVQSMMELDGGPPPDARVFALCGYKPRKLSQGYFRLNFDFASRVRQPGAVRRMFLEPPNGFGASASIDMLKTVREHAQVEYVDALVLRRSKKKELDYMYPGLFEYMDEGFGCVFMTGGGTSVAHAHRGQAGRFAHAKFQAVGSLWSIGRLLDSIKELCEPAATVLSDQLES